MMHMKYLPTKDLFQALIQAKRAFGRTAETVEPVPPTVRSTREDASPFTLRDGLFYEHD